MLKVGEAQKNHSPSQTFTDSPPAAEGHSQRNLPEITNRLFLSSVHAAQDKSCLEKHNITHILNLTGPDTKTQKPRYPNAFEEDFVYKHLCISDEMDTQIKDYFIETITFIKEALASSDNRVLVHCEAGISRSATIVIAYLMEVHHLSLKEAYELVKSKKQNIGPNKSFFQQLIQFEENLFPANPPSISLINYLTDQLYETFKEGGFSKQQVKNSLIKAGLDTNLAAVFLYSE